MQNKFSLLGVYCRTRRLGSLLVLLLFVFSGGCALPLVVPSQQQSAIPGHPAPPQGNMEMHVVDVGQGDGIVLRLPKGTVVVVDTGPNQGTMANYLKSIGVAKIDYLVITHPHADHLGGAQTLLQRFPVKHVYDPAKPHTSTMYRTYLETLLKLVEQGNTSFSRSQAGDRVEFEAGVMGVFVNPGENPPESLNDCSLGLRLTYGSISFFLAGDIESAAEAFILGAKHDISSQVLKVGHHGSRTSSSSAFLAAVRPQIAVISCGKGNDFGHPHAETLRRLEGAKAKVYRTDTNGTVRVITDGKTIKVEVAVGK